jgi:hypothetical protein
MKTEKRGDSGITALINNLNNNDPALDEVRADVRRLLSPPPIPKKAHSKDSPAEYWLRTIGKKIAAIMNLSTRGRTMGHADRGSALSVATRPTGAARQ